MKRLRSRQDIADGLRLEGLGPHRLELARRPREDDHRRALRRDHQAGRRSGRIEGLGSLGHHRLLSVRLPQRVGIEAKPAGEAGEDSGDLLLHSLVENERPAGEPRHHLRRQIICRGAESAARHDQVGALAREESQARFQIRGPVADAQDV